ncbi:DegT/DnrJ/EryC1/StrS family aminotransferase [Petroclostridium sp. X23]|uniref:DegT/DnrJ/EryC1/StrS family aminotransferase n=1 Tax=Petroclostridium sp. X23 TaxID=3045146 RepID=UPI0024AE28BE|nr:DegT/DnrJ/EryC1/StrS family aminotransferase [Petroclostridium sp. X23]WHH61759.1 DegT/DnrJ/EryC1/StrS family aminotransferase [Petroclostridium sp. X23]
MRYKYHMSDINAAIGLAQLKKLDQLNEKRKKIAQKYTESFKAVEWLEIPNEKLYAESSWHLYQVKLPTQEMRDSLINHLKEQDISPGVHYMPIHMHPCYRSVRANVPIASEIWKRILTLPVYPDMQEAETEKVIDAVKQHF